LFSGEDIKAPRPARPPASKRNAVAAQPIKRDNVILDEVRIDCPSRPSVAGEHALPRRLLSSGVLIPNLDEKASLPAPVGTD
jgi:hypothetical protein